MAQWGLVLASRKTPTCNTLSLYFTPPVTYVHFLKKELHYIRDMKKKFTKSYKAFQKLHFRSFKWWQTVLGLAKMVPKITRTMLMFEQTKQHPSLNQGILSWWVFVGHTVSEWQEYKCSSLAGCSRWDKAQNTAAICQLWLISDCCPWRGLKGRESPMSFITEEVQTHWVLFHNKMFGMTEEKNILKFPLRRKNWLDWRFSVASSHAQRCSRFHTLSAWSWSSGVYSIPYWPAAVAVIIMAQGYVSLRPSLCHDEMVAPLSDVCRRNKIFLHWGRQKSGTSAFVVEQIRHEEYLQSK